MARKQTFATQSNIQEYKTKLILLSIEQNKSKINEFRTTYSQWQIRRDCSNITSIVAHSYYLKGDCE